MENIEDEIEKFADSLTNFIDSLCEFQKKQEKKYNIDQEIHNAFIWGFGEDFYKYPEILNILTRYKHKDKEVFRLDQSDCFEIMLTDFIFELSRLYHKYKDVK
jgi:hypothetical protein